MDNATTPYFRVYFNDYIESVWRIKNDIQFWRHFLTFSISNYKGHDGNRPLFASTFSIYDIDITKSSTRLKSHPSHFGIETEHLQEQSEEFFQWIMNLSILRSYNALELLLLRVINVQFYNLNDNSLNERCDFRQVEGRIKNELKDNGLGVNSKNNKYIIEFLKYKSPQFANYISSRIMNKATTWEQFYQFISVLRNIIAHHEMRISNNTSNHLASISNELYNEYFIPHGLTGKDTVLTPKSDHDFLRFTGMINDLAGNSVKFIANQASLAFLNLKEILKDEL